MIISGKVIKGDKYGRELGFPTVNLDRKNFLNLEKKPKFGIWKGVAILNRKSYKAGIVIGPLDKKGLPKIEAYLLDFSKNIYGEKLIIELEKFIRPFKKFKIEADLINQIKKDIEICKK
ncbi:MAG: riboflavin kinase [Candidatus Nomurabacteria bacterium]|nr:riboflavin kinase [Candidatus Nomurabacteria bacterium]